MTTWGTASLDPRGLIGRILVGDHLTLLHNKYVCCGPHGFREYLLKFFFFFFFHYKSVGANDLRGMASLDPWDMIGRIYVGDRKTTY